jgi:hypothetical protein
MLRIVNGSFKVSDGIGVGSGSSDSFGDSVANSIEIETGDFTVMNVMFRPWFRNWFGLFAGWKVDRWPAGDFEWIVRR